MPKKRFQRNSRRTPRGGTRGTLFLEIARLRLDDASTLLEASRYGGAMYIVGYAIECALKWAIAERRGQIHVPAELEHHNWDVLLNASGLTNALQANPVLNAMFSTLADHWNPSLRYNTLRYPVNEARGLYNQYNQLFAWILEITI